MRRLSITLCSIYILLLIINAALSVDSNEHSDYVDETEIDEEPFSSTTAYLLGSSKPCGLENPCIPELKLNVKTVEKFVHGTDQVLTLEVFVTNYGSDAFNALFYMEMPQGMNFKAVRRIDESSVYSCTAPSLETNNTLNCNIGNPLQGGDSIKFRVILKPSQRGPLQSLSYYRINMGVTSTNQEDYEFENTLMKSVEKYPEMLDYDFTFRGSSHPKDFHYDTAQYKDFNSNLIKSNVNADRDYIRNIHESEIGPQVVHVIGIRNSGASLIEEAEIYINWPAETLDGEPLMYLMVQPETLGAIRCDASPHVNTANIQVDEALNRKLTLGKVRVISQDGRSYSSSGTQTDNQRTSFGNTQGWSDRFHGHGSQRASAGAPQMNQDGSLVREYEHRETWNSTSVNGGPAVTHHKFQNRTSTRNQDGRVNVVESSTESVYRGESSGIQSGSVNFANDYHSRRHEDSSSTSYQRQMEYERERTEMLEQRRIQNEQRVRDLEEYRRKLDLQILEEQERFRLEEEKRIEEEKERRKHELLLASSSQAQSIDQAERRAKEEQRVRIERQRRVEQERIRLEHHRKTQEEEQRRQYEASQSSRIQTTITRESEQSMRQIAEQKRVLQEQARIEQARVEQARIEQARIEQERRAYEEAQALNSRNQADINQYEENRRSDEYRRTLEQQIREEHERIRLEDERYLQEEERKLREDSSYVSSTESRSYFQGRSRELEELQRRLKLYNSWTATGSDRNSQQVGIKNQIRHPNGNRNKNSEGHRVGQNSQVDQSNRIIEQQRYDEHRRIQLENERKLKEEEQRRNIDNQYNVRNTQTAHQTHEFYEQRKLEIKRLRELEIIRLENERKAYEEEQNRRNNQFNVQGNGNGYNQQLTYSNSQAQTQQQSEEHRLLEERNARERERLRLLDENSRNKAQVTNQGSNFQKQSNKYQLSSSSFGGSSGGNKFEQQISVNHTGRRRMQSLQDGEDFRSDLIVGAYKLDEAAQAKDGLYTAGLDLGQLSSSGTARNEMNAQGSSSGGSSSQTSSNYERESSYQKSSPQGGSSSRLVESTDNIAANRGQSDFSQSADQQENSGHYEYSSPMNSQQQSEFHEFSNSAVNDDHDEKTYSYGDEKSFSSSSGRVYSSGPSSIYRSGAETTHWRPVKREVSSVYSDPLCRSYSCVSMRCVVGPLMPDTSASVALRMRIVAKTLDKLGSTREMKLSTMAIGHITKLPNVGQPANDEVKNYEVFVTAINDRVQS